MDEELEKYSLDNEEVLDSSLDLQELRQDALSRIQKYSGQVWTDHNVHDTGIAIIEQLCFAIADVSYQFGQLTDQETLHKSLENSPYFGPDRIEQKNFITFQDFTQRVMEHPGIYKVFYINSISNPTVKGLYDMVVFTESKTDINDVEYHLNELINSWRPVGTSIVGYHFPPEREIDIQLSIEVNEANNLQQVVDAYLSEIKAFLQGKNQIEDLSEYRIIDINDFSNKVEFELQAAELVARINSIRFTNHIRNIELKDPTFDFVWTLTYPRPYRLKISPNSQVSIYLNGSKITEWKATNEKDTFVKHRKTNTIESKMNRAKTQQVEFGSLQNDFPESYGLEKDFVEPLGDEDSSSLQLKGLLSTYDLLLSKFLAQLEQAYQILNDQTPNLTHTAAAILDSIPGMEFILKDFNESHYQQSQNKTQRSKAWKEYLQGKKNNLHEIVNSTHRVETEYLETQISSYRFLLSLMGYDLSIYDGTRESISLEDESVVLKNLLSFWLENRLLRIHTKRSYPNCLDRDAQIGYSGQIAKTLGLEFNTTKFTKGIGEIIQLITEAKGNSIQIEGDFDDLIRWGRNLDSYQLDERSQRTHIINHKNEVIARFENSLSESQIDKAIDKLNRVNDLSKGYLLIEHFEFTPSVDEAVFGVQITSGDRPILDIPPKFSLTELYAQIKNLESSFDSGNYKLQIKEVGRKQFQNHIHTDGIFQPISGFYQNSNDAKIEHPRLRKLLNKSKLNYQFTDTQFYKDSFSSDPYSQSITICFPDWNEHFYGRSRKKKILNLLDQITPSHLLINTIWLGPFEYHELIQTINEYHRQKNQNVKKGIREKLFDLIA